jgi:hypothetical protein
MSIAFVYFLCYLLISSELLKSTNSKIMLKIKVHDSSAVTLACGETPFLGDYCQWEHVMI